MRFILTLVVVMLLSSQAIANDVRNSAAISPPTIRLSQPSLKAIGLTELNVESEVVDNLATSTYELVFFNPNNRVLEGELVFSLFDGQNVIDYALRINGKYRSASVVPKAKAKEAFENTIRAQIDPGLLEKTVGNNFKTRIYPIPANGYKKVKITIQETLVSSNGKLHYRMPFVSKTPLNKLTLNMMFVSFDKTPVVNQAGFNFDKVSQGYSLKLEKANVQLKTPLSIALEENNAQGVFVKTVGRDKYILSSLKQDQQILQLSSNTKRKASNNIAVIWSHSFSNRLRDKQKELAFLEAVLKQQASSTVQLIFHSNEVSKPQSLKVCGKTVKCPSGVSIAELKSLISKQQYDGSSNYARVDISQIKADEILFFTNGIRTFYEYAELKNINQPITLVNSSICRIPQDHKLSL